MPMLEWLHPGASSLAAFLASLVECVEALTVVLAVGAVRGWRSVLSGTATGLGLLAVLVLLFGPLLGHVPIPLAWLRLALGSLLFVFGLTWLRKAMLRAAGIMRLRDEARVYEEKKHVMQEAARAKGAWDWLAFVTGFKAIVIEGLEVVFIVIAVGAAQASLAPAATGAILALALVILLGIILHKPLMRVPENDLKFGVGVILTAFGIFWAGKGLGFAWPGDDLAIVGLMVIVLAAALLSVQWIKGKGQE